jgi:hypothetical protein
VQGATHRPAAHDLVGIECLHYIGLGSVWQTQGNRPLRTGIVLPLQSTQPGHHLFGLGQARLGNVLVLQAQGRDVHGWWSLAR